MRTLQFTVAIPTLALVCACAPDLMADDAGMEPEVMVDEMGGPQVGHNDEGDGVFVTLVDATSEEDWIYLDMADGSQLDVSDPQADGDWDLAFQRFHIKLNGGVSGSAGVEAVKLAETTFDEVEVAPADGYISDQADGDDDNDHPDYVLQDWYDYNFMTHVLTPAVAVYVVRTADPVHYKIQLENYYDEAGTSGYLSFRWSRIEGP